MDGTIGEIRMWSADWAPSNWSLCQGQLIAISRNNALFSIIGTKYGGDGRSSFGLPNLQGRVPMGAGRGPGLTPRLIGQAGGQETVTLNILNMPSHNHMIMGTPGASGHIKLSKDSALRDTPQEGDVPAVGNFSSGLGSTQITNNFGSNTNTVNGQEIPGFNPSSLQVGQSGGSQSHQNMQPFIVVNFIICMYGLYPSRS